MLIAARHLVDRLRHPRSRADEVAALRRRLAAVGAATPEARRLAAEVMRLREALGAAFEGTTACAGCARGYPPPHGRWPGGHCCGGPTDGVFTDDEVAALALGGVRGGELVPPPPGTDHAGCAFRGAGGCSLTARERPTVCAAYVCRDLARGLFDRGRLDEVEALAAELRRAFDAFRAIAGAWPPR